MGYLSQQVCLRLIGFNFNDTLNEHLLLVRHNCGGAGVSGLNSQHCNHRPLETPT